MGASAPRDQPTARIRRPGVERILAARRAGALTVKNEARHRFVALGIVLVAASILSPAFALLAPVRTFTVATGSMEPTIPQGSLVWAEDREPSLGDVVVYLAPVGDFQVHRIVDLVDVEGEIQYVTRGDANDAVDTVLVHREWIVGVVTRDIPYVGNLWLIPLSTQALVFFLGIGLYVGICAWDARALLNGPKFQFTLASIVVLMLVPSVWGGTQATLPASTQSASTVATRTPFQDAAMGTATIDPDLAQASLSVIGPLLWKEVIIYSCTTTAACTAAAPGSSAWQTQTSSVVHINAADYTPAPTFYLEAYMAAPSGATISARLIDKSTGLAVAGTTASTMSTTAVAARTTGFTLTLEKDYQVQIMNTGSASGGTFHQAKLLSSQEFPTETQTQIFLSGAGTTSSGTSTTTAKSSRWLYESSAFDGLTSATFEAHAQVAVTGGGLVPVGQVTLYDLTSSTAAKTLSFTLVSTGRVAETFTITDGHEYEVRMSATATLGTPTLTLHVARILLQQDSFTKTARYADLSLPTTSTSTTFVEAGYSAAYEMATEWGDRTAYLEAVFSVTSAQKTASAELYNVDIASTVAASQVDTSATSATRVRSSAVTLSADASDYQLRIKTTGATATLQHAWLISHQTIGKTFDPVMEVKHNVLNVCTWDMSLHSVASSNLGRLAGATVGLQKNDAATQTQLVVSAGAITQSSGATVALAYLDSAEFVVGSNPSSAGASTIDAELRSTCNGSGIRTAQPVTFTFA